MSGSAIPLRAEQRHYATNEFLVTPIRNIIQEAITRSTLQKMYKQAPVKSYAFHNISLSVCLVFLTGAFQWHPHKKHAGKLNVLGALRWGRHELDGRRQGRGGGRRTRLRAAIREREAPTVQTSGQKHLSSTLTLSTETRKDNKKVQYRQKVV